MNHVHQKDPNGCGYACLAMVLGKTYDQVAEDFSAMFDGETPGLYNGDLSGYLMVYGRMSVYFPMITGCRKPYRVHVKPWPPKLICDVNIARIHVGKPAGIKCHYVCVKKDGTVFDPIDKEHDPSLRWTGITEKYEGVEGVLFILNHNIGD